MIEQDIYVDAPAGLLTPTDVPPNRLAEALAANPVTGWIGDRVVSLWNRANIKRQQLHVDRERQIARLSSATISIASQLGSDAPMGYPYTEADRDYLVGVMPDSSTDDGVSVWVRHRQPLGRFSRQQDPGSRIDVHLSSEYPDYRIRTIIAEPDLTTRKHLQILQVVHNGLEAALQAEQKSTE